ncbi:MAG: hypothetical protein PHV82_12260 [Victivallaceae bacterium]|nr:hypothetical protein [Victivallaceae bacterium]
MKKTIRLLILAMTLCLLAGCGDRKPAVAKNTIPFERAIADYCRAHNYGMKVKEFVSLKVNGAKAEATAKMQEAEGTYGLAVKWEFKFQKQPHGNWKATAHTAK